MKTKTVSGTKVEIIGIIGLSNQVIVKVEGRTSITQANAYDLYKPEGDLVPELVDLHFFDPIAAASNAVSQSME